MENKEIEQKIEETIEQKKKPLGLIIGAVALVVIMIVAGFVYNNVADEVVIEDNRGITPVQAINFEFTDINGNQVSLEDFAGKPTVINYWASWCYYCKLNQPYFDELYQEYGKDVNFIMLNATDGRQETEDIAKAYLDTQGYNFPVYFDYADLGGQVVNQSFAYYYGVSAYPTTIFINADGLMEYAIIGGTDKETLEDEIIRVMATKVPALDEIEEDEEAFDESIEAFEEVEILPQATERIGTYAPEYTYTNADLKEVKLSDLYGGKPIVINYWTTWCGSCQEEREAIQKAYETYGDDVIFLGINGTAEDADTVEVVLEYMLENAFTYPVVYDYVMQDGEMVNRGIRDIFDVRSFPTTLYIEPNGFIQDVAVGNEPFEEIAERIERLIAE